MQHDCGERRGRDGTMGYCFECEFDGGFTPNWTCWAAAYDCEGGWKVV